MEKEQNEYPAKESNRRAGIKARKALSKEEAGRLSREICRALTESDLYKRANVIFSYSPFGGEVDVSFLNDQAGRDGKTLALPICRGGGEMIAAVPLGPDSFEVGKYGIGAPIEERSNILDPSEIHLVIVPCTAFEGNTRNRVGMGAGYYDRYLPLCRNAVCVAVAFEAQHIRNLTFDPWDVALDAIVTEARWY